MSAVEAGEHTYGNPILKAKATLRALKRLDTDIATRAADVENQSDETEPFLRGGAARARSLSSLAPRERAQRRWQSASRRVLAAEGQDFWARLRDQGSATLRGGSGFCAPWRDVKEVYGLVTGSWLNLLLLTIPLGILSKLLKWNDIATFGLNFLALVPLALLLGEVTEDLAVRFGPTIGGLLNATFGNVVELILSISALLQGLNDVVQLSLLGSVLSNLLLVLGFCFLCGGARFHQQSFNTMVNKACCSLLLMASISLAIPTVAHQLFTPRQLSSKNVLDISHGTAIILVLMYLAYLFFTLKTHSQSFEAEEPPEDSAAGTSGSAPAGAGAGAGPGGGPGASGDSTMAQGSGQGQGGHEHSEEPKLSLAGALLTLAGITVVVAACSEFLTGAIDSVSKELNINKQFLGLIVLPIAGNAAEHITAVFVALKDKMDLAIGVALGSSIQIAVFVLPVVVLVGWVSGAPLTYSVLYLCDGHPLSLNFDPFAILVLTLSVIHTYLTTADGQTNWLMGVQLLGTYTLIALLYVFLDLDEEPHEHKGPLSLLWPGTAS